MLPYLNVLSSAKKQCLISFPKLSLLYIQILLYTALCVRLISQSDQSWELLLLAERQLTPCHPQPPAKPLLALLLVQRSVSDCTVLSSRGHRSGEARN